MILIIGGRAQGKREFAKTRFSLSDDEIYTVPQTGNDSLNDEEIPETVSPETELSKGNFRAIDGYHRAIYEQLRRGENPETAFSNLLKQYPHIILVADEVGMGIVPIEKNERDYRDAVGHVLTLAAASSDEVYRVIAGLGQRVK